MNEPITDINNRLMPLISRLTQQQNVIQPGKTINYQCMLSIIRKCFWGESILGGLALSSEVGRHLVKASSEGPDSQFWKSAKVRLPLLETSVNNSSCFKSSEIPQEIDQACFHIFGLGLSAACHKPKMRYAVIENDLGLISLYQILKCHASSNDYLRSVH